MSRINSQNIDFVHSFTAFPDACFLLILFVLDEMYLLWIFTPRILGSAVGYLVGLVLLDKYQNPHGIARFLEEKSHDSFTYLLSCLSTSSGTILGSLVQVARRLPVGNFIIDEVIIEKPFSKNTFGCAWHFDHSSGKKEKHIYGQRFVVIIWNLGPLLIPIAFQLWLKEDDTASEPYYTKNEIALSLLKELLAEGLRARYVLFDSWYASERLLKFLQNRGIKFVTRFKSDRVCIINQKQFSLSQFAEKLRPRYRVHIRAYSKEFYTQWHSLQLKGVLLKKDTSQEPGNTKFIFTNDISLKPLQIVKLYRSRWNIEVFFRDTKQHLGLKKFIGRTELVIRNHTAYVFLAYAILSWLKLPHQSIGDIKRLIQKKFGEKNYREGKGNENNQDKQSSTLKKEIALKLGISSFPTFSDIRSRIAS